MICQPVQDNHLVQVDKPWCNYHVNRKDSIQCQGSKLKVASSKFATWKSHLLPIEKVGSKKLLPGNSVVKVISGM